MTDINLQSHTEVESGYGRFGRFVKRELEALGVVSLGDLGVYPELDPSTVEPGRAAGCELARVALWLSTPPHVRGWYEGQFATIFTMWESSEIPPGFRTNIDKFDRIFVPSLQNQELYGRFHPDVRYIPLGVAGSWAPRARPPVRTTFEFLTAGFGPRKGVEQVIEAFHTVFPDPDRMNPRPHLTCRSKQTNTTARGVDIIHQTLDGPEERDLYARAHCFVSGSKGEGWGLMPLQAITQGCPTILGDAHGHAAFAHYGIPIGTHPYKCAGATFWGDGGEWWEPDFGQMCEAMEDVYSRYEHYERAAAWNAHLAYQEFSWRHTAEKIVFELADQLYEEPPRTRVWKPAPGKLFHIRVNKAVTYTINGQQHSFLPGQDYYEAPDLKRQILASGHLDMSTFDPHDLGVEDSPDFDHLRAINSICPTCHQKYNIDKTPQQLVDEELGLVSLEPRA